MTAVLDDERALAGMREASYFRHAESFTWSRVLPEYEQVLLEALEA